MSKFLAVFIGGGMGSCLRYALSLWISTPKSGFPMATLAANLLSCCVLGLSIRFLVPKQLIAESWKLLVLVGFCGGFSTFSTFSRETFVFLQQGNWLQLMAYLGASIIGCWAVLWGVEGVKF